MTYPVSSFSLARAKRVGRLNHPNIKASHLSELLAGGFGFRTKAAMDATLQELGGAEDRPWAVDLPWDDAMAVRRADEIGSPRLTLGFPRSRELMTLNRLEHVDAWEVERFAHLAKQARTERDAILPMRGNMGVYSEREKALTAEGKWPTPLNRELDTKIRSLSPEQLVELQAVMWLHWEHMRVSPVGWEPKLEHARRTHQCDEYAANYLLSKGSLGLWLLEGLNVMARWFVADQRPH